ncbi:MAG TPA: aspartate aminotransferase family protein [Gemmatimonadaceae bacterium]|nr:aspartate aminotransferase family protein [Gemmatimonadaceae bacterium]
MGSATNRTSARSRATTGADSQREAPLRMDTEAFRRAGHALVDSIATFLDSVPERPVTRGESPEEIRSALDAKRTLPDKGDDAAALLRDASRLLYEHSLLNGHPRFFGYITSSPAPIGMLADLLASAVNPNVGAWRLSPMASEIEAQTIRWIAELVGYPTSCGGLLVSGGNMANIVGLFAARAAAAQWDVRTAGVAASAARPLRVYASKETHTWLQKAADLSGLGTDSVRWITTDDDLRMDVAELRAAVERDRAAGDLPMMVVGTAGSVSTGAVDPLTELAELCQRERIWFHVDGAYGAFAAALLDAPAELRSLSLADSVAMDPHKWLYAPLEVGCVLVRDAERLRNAFSYHPPYYHFGQEATNFVDLGPQNSRGFRALKVWLALRQVGREGYVRMIGDDVRLAGSLHAVVTEHPDLEPFTLALSISTFRYVPRDLRSRLGEDDVEHYLDALNKELLERIQLSGEAFVSNAVIRGRYVLRACIVNFNTTPADVESLPDIVARIGRDVDSAIRPRAQL